MRGDSGLDQAVAVKQAVGRPGGQAVRRYGGSPRLQRFPFPASRCTQPTSFFSVLLVLASFIPASSYAQTIRGKLIDETTGSPIAGAFVVLLGDSAVERGRTATDRNGQFTLNAPAPGRYTLKSQIIGIRSVVSPAIDLAAGKILDYRFEMPAVLVVLPVVVVEDERICRTRPEAGLAAVTLWEEAQKALSAVAWTERQGFLRHHIVRYDRELHPRSLQIKKQDSRSSSGLYRGSPFSSMTAKKLATSGYIEDVGSNEFYYYAPDADVLLSDEFASLHCFSVRQGDRDAQDLIGLAFRPIPGRKVPDIEGVLWMDQKSVELRHVEYRYTRLPFPVEAARIGGRIEFEHLPDGPWIVRRWWIRMPIVGIRPSPTNRLVLENYLVAIKEDGGWVSEIYTLGGQPVSRGRGATLVGTVLDNTSSAPLVGASVVLVGTHREAKTDEKGRFRFDDLPEGTFLVTFVHQTLDDLDFIPPPAEVTLVADRADTVTLSVPTQEAVWSLLCPDSDPLSGTAIVAGFVQAASSREPLAGARVIVSGSRWIARANRALQEETVRVEGVTDGAGYYRVCDVPAGLTMSAAAKLDGWSGTTTSMMLWAGDMRRLDFGLRPVKR